MQFWMGHIVRAGQEEHYRPTDVKFHRKLYAEKAMPFLRLETATPTETEKTIAELRKQLNARDEEIDSLKESVAKLKPLADFVNSFKAPEELRKLFDDVRYEFADSSDGKLRPLKIEFSPHVSEKLDEIAKTRGITRKEALEQLVKEDLEIMKKGEEDFKKLEKRAKKET